MNVDQTAQQTIGKPIEASNVVSDVETLIFRRNFYQNLI